MIRLLQEKTLKIEEFRKMTWEELITLRQEISDRLCWLFTTENYDEKKSSKLQQNEKKINKVIKERL